MEKMAQIESLKGQLQDVNQTLEEAFTFKAKVESLYDSGLIKENIDGSFSVIDDPEERAF